MTNAFSQVDSIDYSKFKMPDLVRREFIFDVDFSNFNTFIQYMDTSIISEKSNEFSLSNNFNMNYLYTKNSRKYQGLQEFSIYSFFQFENEENDSITNNNKNIYSKTYFGGKNRMYLNEKLFYELNYGFSYSNTFVKTVTSNSGFWQYMDINGYSYHSYSLSPSFAFGYGRIEPITDVVHAMVYLKNLKRENRLSKDLDEESIFEFAKILAEAKNKRFFDSRKKKMYELEKIDSFLNINNYVTNKDIKYFSVVEDIWEYAGNFPRYSGKRMSFNFIPNYNVLIFNDLSADTSDMLISRSIYTMPYFSFVIGKPVNEYVQRNLYADLGYRYYTLVLTRDTTYKGTSQWFLNLGLSYGFYPNTRTYLETSLRLLYSRIITEKENELTGYFVLKAYYYIAPRLRFFMESDVNFDCDYFLDRTESDRYLRYTINAGLQFALF
jgi:hypothetical protein